MLRPFLLGLGLLVAGPVAAQSLTFWTRDTTARAGDTVDVAVRTRAFRQLITAQGTLVFDSTLLDCVAVRPGPLAGLGGANFGDRHRAHLTFAWIDQALTGQSLPDSAVFCTLRFRVVGAVGSVARVGFGQRPTPPEFTAVGFVAVPAVFDSSTVTIVGPQAVDAEAPTHPFAAWPNPVAGTLHVSEGPAVELVEAATGRRYRRPVGPQGTVVLDGLPPGTYLLRGRRLVVLSRQ